MKSTIVPLLGFRGGVPSSPGQAKLGRALVPTTGATFPEGAAMAIVPVASGAGRGTPLAVPPDSRTRKYLPGTITPLTRLVFELPKLAPTLAYWTEYGVTLKSTVVVPRLKISTKSFW